MLNLSACAWLDQQQRANGYKPTPGTMADWKVISPNEQALWLPITAQLPADADQMQADGSPQQIRAIWIPSKETNAPAVLYLHGTFRNMFQNRPKIAAIHEAGFSVLALDYRGWGESTPLLPSESTINQDAQAAWAELGRLQPNANYRVIFGHSMGSGVAVELAYRQPSSYAALVLEAPMTSMPDIARDYGWFGPLIAPLVTQQFASIDKIASVSAPTWFLTGSADNTVPSQQALRLYDKATGEKHLEVFDGGSHSGLHKEFKERYLQTWAAVANRVQLGKPSLVDLPPTVAGKIQSTIQSNE